MKDILDFMGEHPILTFLLFLIVFESVSDWFQVHNHYEMKNEKDK